MRRRLPDLPLLALVCALTVGAASMPAQGAPTAAGAAATCQGEPATLVGTGSPGESLEGTTGRDVIVSNGAARVVALAGDDLICVTHGPLAAMPAIVVLDGDGEDATYVEAPDVGDQLVDVFLQGAGTDVLRGGPADELVVSYSGADDISGGAGHDSVYVLDDVAPDEPFAGRVDLGADGGSLTLQRPGTTEAAMLDGGTGSGLFYDHAAAGDWLVDNQEGTATLDGLRQVSWSHFRSFAWGLNRVTFQGSAAAESLSAPNLVRADMGPGDDSVAVGLGPDSARGARAVDGGPGRDRLSTADRGPEGNGRATIDVPHQLASYAGAGLTMSFAGFEDFQASAGRVTILGGPRGEVLTAYACVATIHAGGGADRVVNGSDAEDECGPTTRGRLWGDGGDDVLLGGYATSDTLYGGPGADVLRLRLGRPGAAYGGAGADLVLGGRQGDRLAGQRGDDVLRGRTGPDVLLGGAGRDTTDGGPGRDRCVAERRLACEA